jgi:hypothetical protein
MTNEQLYVQNIENSIRAIRLRMKNPQDINLLSNFNRLKVISLVRYNELMSKYQNVKKDYQNSLVKPK